MLSNNLQNVLTQFSDSFKQSSHSIDTISEASYNLQMALTRFADDFRQSLEDTIADASSDGVNMIFRCFQTVFRQLYSSFQIAII